MGAVEETGELDEVCRLGSGTEGGLEGEYMHGQHQPMKHDQVPQHSTNQNLTSDHM